MFISRLQARRIGVPLNCNEMAKRKATDGAGHAPQSLQTAFLGAANTTDPVA